MINNNNYMQSAEKINQIARAWKNETKRILIRNVATLATSGREFDYTNIRTRVSHSTSKLQSNIRGHEHKQYGQIDKLSFSFLKHGVFLQKGVGRGYRSKNGRVYKVSPSRTTGFNRSPKDWFNSTLDNRVPILADKLGEEMANAVVKATNAKIK